MLSTIHIIQHTMMQIDGKIYMVSQWNAPVRKILNDHVGGDVYIYEPTLHSNTPQGFVIYKHKKRE